MGGTVTNLAAVKHGLAEYDPDVVNGTRLDVAEIDRQIETYRSRGAEERHAIVGLQPNRAEVILGGALHRARDPRSPAAIVADRERSWRTARRVRRPLHVNIVWFSVAGAGAILLVASVVGARHTYIPAWEMRVFRVVNGLPAWLFYVLWLPMQLGNLVVGTGVALAIAWWAHELDVAAGIIAATFLKLVTERVVRREMAAYLQVRQRPGTSEPGAILRGKDVPSEGPSFPSGHVILVAAAACLVAPLLPTVGVWVAFFLTLLVMIGRVYVGAHNPLDVVAGLGAGLVLGGVLTALFG